MRSRTPWVAGDGGAVEEGEGERLAHEGERGVAAGEQLLGGDLEQRREELPEFDDALDPPVVARIDPARCAHVVAADRGEEAVCEVELLASGLAAGDVEAEPAGGELLVGARGCLECGLEVGGRGHRCSFSPRCRRWFSPVLPS